MAAPCWVLADEKEDSGGYFDELPVVLSASRLVQTLDQAPAAVTVIDREMIKASGARELIDVFRLVPGMVVGQYKGHQPVLGFHGFADPYFRQLQVLIDGVSVYSPVWGGADWSQLPIVLEDIERIEVVRGPNAATFGANSFLGVVNIITRDPAVEHGGELSVNFGENGIRDEIVRYATGHGDLRYRFTAGQRSDYGLDSHPDTRRSNLFNMRGHWGLGPIDELRWQLGYVGGSQEQGVYSGPNHTDGPRTSHYDAGSLQLRWTRTHDADNEIWAQFSYSERNHRELLPYTLQIPGIGSWDYPLDFGYQYRRSDVELQDSMRLADSVRSAWGAQVRQDEARSRTYFGSDDRQYVNLYRLFGNLEWRPAANWIVASGAMIEKNSVTGSSVSPSMAVNYQVLPGHSVRVRMANARRTPTLYEERFDWHYELPAELRAQLALMPAPFPALATLPLAGSVKDQQDLEDERIRSREISYLGQFPQQHLSVELGVFQHHIDRLLAQYKYYYETAMGDYWLYRYLSTGNASYLSDAQKFNQVAGFANLDSAIINGESIAAYWRPRPGTLVYLSGAQTVIHADGANADLIRQSTPKRTISALVSQRLTEDWRVSLSYYRVGEMKMLSGGDVLPPTQRTDVVIAKHFRVAPYQGEIALVVKNATDDGPVFELRDIDRRTTWLSMRIEY